MKTPKGNPIFFIALLLTVLASSAQNKVVHGTVSLFDTIAVENAEVTTKKTDNRVFTDSLGRFTIECRAKDKLGIKATGFKTKTVAVKGAKDSLEIKLEIQGGESELSLAVSEGHLRADSIDLAREHLEARTTYSYGYTNMTDLITAKFPNISIVGDEIILRGLNSTSNRNGAVIILKGAPYSWDTVRNMDVNEVKNIRVLKGAEAARYGNGSGNGVILIQLN